MYQNSIADLLSVMLQKNLGVKYNLHVMPLDVILVLSILLTLPSQHGL